MFIQIMHVTKNHHALGLRNTVCRAVFPMSTRFQMVVWFLREKISQYHVKGRSITALVTHWFPNFEWKCEWGWHIAGIIFYFIPVLSIMLHYHLYSEVFLEDFLNVKYRPHMNGKPFHFFLSGYILFLKEINTFVQQGCINLINSDSKDI